MQRSRRRFIAGVGACTVGGLRGADSGRSSRLSLGYDNFAVRAMGWKAPRLVEYAAQLKCDTLFVTDFGPFERLDDDYFGDIRKMGEDAGVRVLLGSWSICPTSETFKDDWGTADEHLQLGIRAARALGSPAFRVILGSHRDRLTEGGIGARIADTVAVLKRNRSRCIDAGVKVAVENHAGDMHSLELLDLIERAGPDFVGANFDSGNAVWTMEDPLQALENLGRHILTTSLRDSAVWESEKGVTVQWTAMGRGDIDLRAFFRRFAELCPDVAVNIETISGFNKELPVGDAGFWKAWPGGKPKGYGKFLDLAKEGRPREAWKAPEGMDRREAQKQHQRAEIEESIRYCRKELGLGLRPDAGN